MHHEKKGKNYKIYNFLLKRGVFEQVLDSIVSEIDDSEVGFAGFETSEGLRNSLFQEMKDSDNVFNGFDAEKHELVSSVVEDALVKCQESVFVNKTFVYVFPTLSRFVNKEMLGSTGYSPWKNTMHIYVGDLGINWKKVIVGTIFHEYCHSVMLNFHEWNTNLDTLIFEGMAELFREENSESYTPPWISVFSVEDGKKIFDGLWASLDRVGLFEDEKLPLWTKYTLGYQIVKSFRNKNQDIAWVDLVKLSPSEIFERSGYIKNPST